jgi:hypothetical protein
MAQTYDFQEKLREGQRHERYLDEHYRDRFVVEPASRADERRGIDRYFTERRTGRRYAIQYKADTTAARTGNAFIETLSVDTSGAPGWALSCQADFIVYYVVGIGPAYVIRPAAIRRQMARWEREYPSRRIANRGYHTVGLLVPLDELERIAHAVVSL